MTAKIGCGDTFRGSNADGTPINNDSLEEKIRGLSIVAMSLVRIVDENQQQLTALRVNDAQLDEHLKQLIDELAHMRAKIKREVEKENRSDPSIRGVALAVLVGAGLFYSVNYGMGCLGKLIFSRNGSYL